MTRDAYRHAVLAIAASVWLSLSPISDAAAQRAGKEVPKDHINAPQSQRPDDAEMLDDVRMLRGLHGERLEETFLTMMLDHHRSGVDMARLGARKAQDPALRRLAERIAAAQMREIPLMEGWLSSWFNNPYRAKTDYRMGETMDRLQRLSGSEFDRVFAMEMAKHHESGIRMSQPVRARATHAELRRFAVQLSDNQRREQKELRRLAS